MTDTGIPVPPSVRPLRIGLGRDVAISKALVLVLGATLLGGVLRAAAATGDLGLDEVWSLRLVARVHGLGQVFWGLSHDNNHVLNSAWLYLLGPDRPFWLYRLPAVVFGTLTVPALARLCWRRSPAAGVIAAMLGGVALPLVDFGSEARGYAGLALATVLAFDEGERALDAHLGDDRIAGRRARWRLGAAVGFGALCHLTMLSSVMVLGLAVSTRLTLQDRRLKPALAITLATFRPAALMALPTLASVLAGILVCGGFTIGDRAPFSIESFFHGFGGLMLLMVGLSDATAGLLGVGGAMALLAVAARYRLAAPSTIMLGVAGLVVLPAAAAAARLPNVGYCRYFSVCGLVLLALTAETLGTLWAAGPDGRRRATAAVLAMMIGSLAQDGLSIRDGRGGFGETLALMRAEGRPLYATDHPAMAELLLGGAARREGPGPTAVAMTDLCTTPPDWFLAVGTFDPEPGRVIALGTSACRLNYENRRFFAASPVSGTQLTLYRRRDPPRALPERTTPWTSPPPSSSTSTAP